MTTISTTRVVSPWYRPLLLIILASFLLVAAQGTGVAFFARMAYLLLGVVVGALLWALLGIVGLTITRTLQTPRVMVGDIIHEHIVVRNQLPWRRGIVEVLNDTVFGRISTGFVVPLPARQQRQRSWRSVAPLRGVYHVGTTYVVGSDPFGLFRIERRFISPTVLTVVPAPAVMSLPAIGTALATGHPHTVRQFAASAPTIMAVREYRPGDAINRIHWRSTAKRGHLMLKEGMHEPGAHIWLVYDAQRSAHAWVDYDTLPMPLPCEDSSEEYAIQFLANATQRWLDAGHAVGLCLHGTERVVLPPRRGIMQHIAIFDALAAVRASGDMALDDVLMQLDAESAHHTSICVVTSRADAAWVPVLQRIGGRGGDACAAIINAASFGGAHDCQESLAALQHANIPHTVLVRGMDLAMVQWQ